LRAFWLLLTHRYALCYLAITCHGVGFLKDAPFILLCKLFRKKIVIHQHNKGMAKDVDRWLYRWLLPLCYNNAKVILLSWHLYSDIERIVPRENVMICPNGIKVKEYKRPNVYNSPDTNHIPRLLFLSNLIESKGVFVLLDALKILKDKGYSFICDFVGGETKEIDSKRFSEEVNMRQLNRLVFYRGRKYGNEKEEFFKKADMFVFPSMEDCFPLVLLEAMASKLAIVTTTEGAIPDEVKDGENGLIAQKNDAESLATCISKLIDAPELRKKMGQSGRKRLELMFSEEIFEKRMKDILWTSINS
jgi:glycosyltransferase involved in cell wall biosynthesis